MDQHAPRSCAIEHVGKQRNGKPRFWCTVHQASATGRYGVRLPACEGAYLDKADPQEISSEVFLSLLEEHDLGEGETECLALLQKGGYVLCCDDGKARKVGIALVGDDRVVGSIRMLRWAVEDGICTCDTAFEHYEQMKAAGGFLPEIAREWFGV